jgi:hypothetical protein
VRGIMPGQVRDDQLYHYRIAWASPGPVKELNRAAHPDRALGAVAADELETITGVHAALLDERGDYSAHGW